MKPMSSKKSQFSRTLQRTLFSLMSLVLCLFLFGTSANALNDGQQLVLESWSLVNQGYINPEKFNEVQWRKLRQKALESPISNSEDAYAAIEKMLLPLGDPYTRLLRPNDYAAMKAGNIGSEINGVGLQLGARQNDGQIVVIAPLEGSPAAEAGVISGTIVVKVNGESPRLLGLEATAAKLRGEIGSQVVVEVQPPNAEIEELTLERRSVDLRPVRTKRLRNETHTLGYLRITQFSEGVPQQVEEALQELSEKDVEGIVLDLRNNSGGLVSSGLAVADAFLSNAPIVETRNREGLKDEIRSGKETLFNGPMVTLVNGGTASASEILAGALQDNDRSLLIGSKTFGKGLIQSLSTLTDGSGLAVTVAGYQTPSGRYIQNLGIEPDRILDEPEPLNPGGAEDRWLNDAESILGANLDLQSLENTSKELIRNEEYSDEKINQIDPLQNSEA
ncbi:carboxyl-terminal processing protease CtpZ [Prochlorococcus sp. MIT 1341]|uniref:carboxyl-terminal processing protease CtpZ n=1 Tax=Prochlorococcus sp. MIT 1341 TaxID=3096221 RepID=UPI002A751E67|nr:carboxyl-terminal processing protease CtpZ [Prochlorococcus sp. MIT 1341]